MSQNLDLYKSKLAKDISALEKQLGETKSTLKDLRQSISLDSKAITLSNKVLEKGFKVRSLLEDLISDALTYCKEEECIFYFEDVIKDGELYSTNCLIKKGDVVYDNIPLLLGASVSSIINIVSRMFFILNVNGLRNIYIGDEPGSEMDVYVWQRFLEWVDSFCEDFDFQFVVTTHQPVVMGAVYKIFKEGDDSKYERVFDSEL